MALAGSAPPEGQSRGTLRRLAAPAVEWKMVDRVSHESVRPVLKNERKPPLRKRWCLPPKQAAEFVYHREDVLAVYQPPPDPPRPVVCWDETFQPLMGEGREALPAPSGAVERYDKV